MITVRGAAYPIVDLMGLSLSEAMRMIEVDVRLKRRLEAGGGQRPATILPLLRAHFCILVPSFPREVADSMGGEELTGVYLALLEGLIDPTVRLLEKYPDLVEYHDQLLAGDV